MRVYETFRSIQGETSTAGRPMFFIRTALCDLRCTWCDTAYAFEGGAEASVDELVGLAHASGLGAVTLTGGEPLLQPDAPELVQRLLDEGFDVQVETSGARDISPIDSRACRIVDMKCPGSGEGNSFLASNTDALTARDEVKFVIAHRDDFEWARSQILELDLPRRCNVLFSPAWGLCSPRDLAAWILDDGLDVRLGIQIHKVIWEPDTRGV